MAREHRDAHARARDGQIRRLEDFARFVAELLLLVGLLGPVVDDLAGEGHHVEGDGRDVNGRLGKVHRRSVDGELGDVLLDRRANLPFEFFDSGEP